MAQVFSKYANSLFRLFLVSIVLAVVGVVALLYVFDTSTYNTAVGDPVEQPIQFSHEHHVGGLGIDCRYCHTSVEDSPFAGIPPTQICMQCHSQIWADSPKLAPVRASFRTGESISWTRVHDVPDFVYFDHSIHLKKGVACAACHGRVDAMPLTWRAETLHMQWCVECHRDPAPHLRPADRVFAMEDSPRRRADDHETELAAMALMEKHHVVQETDCSVCHR